jgi:hypothetical protein
MDAAASGTSCPCRVDACRRDSYRRRARGTERARALERSTHGAIRAPGQSNRGRFSEGWHRRVPARQPKSPEPTRIALISTDARQTNQSLRQISATTTRQTLRRSRDTPTPLAARRFQRRRCRRGLTLSSPGFPSPLRRAGFRCRDRSRRRRVRGHRACIEPRSPGTRFRRRSPARPMSPRGRRS